VATLTGADAAVTELLAQLDLPEHTEVLGPVPVVGPGAAAGEPGEAAVRLVLRVPRRDGHALSAALAEAQRVRSARKRPAVRVEVDPATLG
jgi:primosomal protein N' (replication factor Y)